MATATSLIGPPSLSCVDTAGATPRPQNHDQKKKQSQKKQKETNLFEHCAFRRFGGPPPAKPAATILALGTPSVTPGTGWRGPVPAVALSLLSVLCVVLSAPLESPFLLQPVAGAPFLLGAASPATVPALVLFLSRGAAAVAPASPTVREDSTTEKASAAVKNRWTIWRQRLNAEEQDIEDATTTGGLEGTPGGDRVAAVSAGQLRDDRPPSSTTIQPEAVYFSVPVAGGALLLTPDTSAAGISASPATESGTSRREGAVGVPEVRHVSGSIPSMAAAGATVGGTLAGPAPSNTGLTALRAASGAGPSSRRIAPFLLSPSPSQLGLGPSSSSERDAFSTSGSGLLHETVAAGGSTVLHTLPTQRRVGALREEGAADSPVVLVAPSAPWISRESDDLQPTADIASAKRGSASATTGFGVYGSGGSAAATAALDAGEGEHHYYRPRPVQQQQPDSTRQHPLAKLQEALRQEQEEQEAAEERGHQLQPDHERGFSPRLLVQQRRPSQQQQQAMQMQTTNVQSVPWAEHEPLPHVEHLAQPQQELGEQHEAALLLPPVDHVHPNIRLLEEEEEDTLSEGEPLSEMWPEAYLPQQQAQVYSAPAGGLGAFDVAGEWHPRRMQQQQQLGAGGVAAGTPARSEQPVGVGGLRIGPVVGNQQEAEALFGRGTTVHLLRSRRDFEAFVRREVVEQQRIAVVLFFGRHCPYCMMFKGVFNKAAASVPASLGRDNVVFAAKEIALFEEDFLEDEDTAGGTAAGSSGPTRRSSAEPVEATLDVNYIPQIRVIAPVGRVKQEQQIAAAAAGTMEDPAIVAAQTGDGEPKDIHSPHRATDRGTPQIYWLPPVRSRSTPWTDSPSRAATGPGGGQQATAYWAGRLSQNEFSPEGIYKYLVENTVVNSPSLAPENTITSSILDAASGPPHTSSLPSPVPSTVLPAFPSALSQNPRFREAVSPDQSPVLTPVEKALQVLQSECKSSDAPALQNAAQRRRHEVLCTGSVRWDGEQERESTLDVRLHDALSTLVYMLKRWVPMGRGKGDRLSREAESVLQRLLEICRITLPWQQVKRRLFKLQVILHLQGSEAEPVYREWREPGGVREDESASSAAFANADGTNKQQQQQGTKLWGWWHSNVESIPAKERARKKKQRHSEDYEAGHEGSTQTGGLPKTAWLAAVKHLQLAGIGEGEEKKPQQPRLLQCETPLCGAWSLFHILTESASATFRDQIRRAVEQASLKGGAATAGDNNSGAKERKKETIDLQFYTPQDNLGTYAVRRYVELLHHNNGISSLASEETESGGSGESGTPKARRKGTLNEDLRYITDVLEDQLGMLDDSAAIEAFEEHLQRLHRRAVFPAAMIQQTLRDFIDVFFSCYSCKDHFLQCYHRGFFGAREVVYPTAVVASAAAAYTAKRQAVLAATAASGGPKEKIVFPAAVWKPVEQGRTGLTAAEVRKEKKNYLHLRLWLWRLHNAVNIRTASEATLNAIAGHPDLFLSEEEWQQTNASRLSSSKLSRDYTVLQQKSLGVGYYLGVDPRWPLRSNCPECRMSGDTSASGRSDNSSSSEVTEAASTRKRGQGFLLTAEYLQQRESEKDICVYSDYYTDLDLRQVKKYLAQTYWTTSRNPRWETLGVDAVFDYRRGAFIIKR